MNSCRSRITCIVKLRFRFLHLFCAVQPTWQFSFGGLEKQFIPAACCGTGIVWIQTVYFWPCHNEFLHNCVVPLLHLIWLGAYWCPDFRCAGHSKQNYWLYLSFYCPYTLCISLAGSRHSPVRTRIEFVREILWHLASGLWTAAECNSSSHNAWIVLWEKSMAAGKMLGMIIPC